MQVDEGIYRSLVDNLHDGVYMLDRQRRITYWNRGAERLTGYTAEEVVGRSCAANILMHTDLHGTPLCTNLCPAALTIDDGTVREESIVLHHKDGHRKTVYMRCAPVHDASGQVIGAVETFTDNAARLASQQRVEELRDTMLLDPLTELGSRPFIEMTVRSRLFEQGRDQRPFGVLFVGIDRLGKINETYGSEVGDRVLKMIAGTLREIADGEPVVGRWEEAAFAVIARAADAHELCQLGERIRRFVRQSSVQVGSEMVWVTASIGATLARPGDRPDTLLGRAAELMARSKATGRDRLSTDADD